MDHLRNAWKSLTIWFNGLAGLLLGMADTLKDYLPFAQSYVTADILKYAAIGIVVVNVLLRFKTKSSLADK